MIIDVLELYNYVNDISRKEQKGYQDVDEFNRKLKAVETELHTFFSEKFQEDQIVTDHMRPFVVNASLAVVGGCTDFPEDYAHRVSVDRVYVKNSGACDGAPESTPYVSNYLELGQVGGIRESVVAGPSEEQNRYYHYFKNNQVCVLPATIEKVDLCYIRYPNFGSIKSTISSSEGEDFQVVEVDVALEWNQHTFTELRARLLRELGFEIKEPDLIEYSQVVKADNQ